MIYLNIKAYTHKHTHTEHKYPSCFVAGKHNTKIRNFSFIQNKLTKLHNYAFIMYQ